MALGALVRGVVPRLISFEQDDENDDESGTAHSDVEAIDVMTENSEGDHAGSLPKTPSVPSSANAQLLPRSWTWPFPTLSQSRLN